MKIKLILFLGFTVFQLAGAEVSFPDDQYTPGALCSRKDPDFNNDDYPEKVARCKRNVSSSDKSQIADEYGSIPNRDWRKYEFDHLIPLCAGGSNDRKNVWPQPLDQAHSKDGLENDICLRMKAGAMRQAQAISLIHQWFYENKSIWAKLGSELASTPVVCRSTNGLKISFVLRENRVASSVLISVRGSGGDFEVLHRESEVTGRGIRAKSALLEGYVRYVINEPGAQDRFELFLPQGLASYIANFDGFLKYAFAENYPKLSPLSCSRQL